MRLGGLMELHPGRLGSDRVLLHFHHPISVHEHRLRPPFNCRILDRSHSPQGLIAVVLRYKGYRANLGRSIIVDPSKVSMRPPLLVTT